tara:strand:- start:18088 stop:19443 length:1356 start_codon:yes stop_codon:yes gene_type:complete
VPVPGVTFAVGTWTPEGGYQVLHNWIADERGLASGFVRVPVQEDARVWACPVSPGLQQRKAIARQVAEEWRVQPALVEGATARGHILGPNGLSAISELVLLHQRRVVPAAVHQFTGWPNRFELHFTQTGIHELRARSEDVGTAIQAVSLDLNDPAQDLVLQLQSTGSISGRLVDCDGLPIRERWVLLTQDAPDLRPNSRRSSWPWIMDPEGLRQHQVLTDPMGAFVANGLAQGSYVITTDTDGIGWSTTKLTDQPVALGTKDLLLVDQTHLVRIRVLDADGNPVPFDPLAGAIHPDDVNEFSPRMDMPVWREGEVLELVARRTDGLGVAKSWVANRCWRETEDPTVWEMIANPGHSYMFTVFGPNRELVQQELAVPNGAVAQSVDLQLAHEVEPGRVRLTVDTPKAVEGDMWHFCELESIEYTLRDPSSQVLLFERRRLFGAAFECLLPPG